MVGSLRQSAVALRAAIGLVNRVQRTVLEGEGKW